MIFNDFCVKVIWKMRQRHQTGRAAAHVCRREIFEYSTIFSGSSAGSSPLLPSPLFPSSHRRACHFYGLTILFPVKTKPKTIHNYFLKFVYKHPQLSASSYTRSAPPSLWDWLDRRQLHLNFMTGRHKYLWPALTTKLIYLIVACDGRVHRLNIFDFNFRFLRASKNYENILMAMPPFPLPIPHPSLSRCFNFFKIIFNELDNA